MAARWRGTLWLVAMATGGAWAELHEEPAGCRWGTRPVYFLLCSLRAAWGIVFVALASVGLLVSVLLALALLACAWRRRSKGARGGARQALQLLVAAGALGLFGLVFAFVVRPHPGNCSARRFLFGTLSALAFASLAAQAGGLAWQARTGRASSGLVALLVALGLFLLECLINAEWLLATTVRGRPLERRQTGQNPCSIAKKDFVASLVYVMALLAAALVLSAVGLCCRRRASKRRAAYLLAASCLSAGVWVAWIIVYLCSERRAGWRPKGPWYLRQDAWDDSPLALALLVNAWVLVLCCLVPWLMEMRRQDEEEEDEYEGSSDDQDAIGLQKTSARRAYTENKAFDSEDGLGKRFPSPYQDLKTTAKINLDNSLDSRISTGSGAAASLRWHSS